MKKSVLILFVLVFPDGISTANAVAVDIEPYLPKNAVAKAAFITTTDDVKCIEYVEKGTNQVVAERLVLGGTATIELKLLRDGRLNGVQRKWHPNGVRSSESPYVDGIMDGLFRQWDTGGALVARYLIVQGNGIKIIYHSNGTLNQITPYRDNKQEGTEIEFFDNGQIEVLNPYLNGKFHGLSLYFYSSGALRALGYMRNGAMHGPMVYFKDSGEIQMDPHFYVNGERVDRENYIAECVNDKNLPPYESDPKNYRGVLDKRYMELIDRYKRQKPVKIPLDDN